MPGTRGRVMEPWPLPASGRCAGAAVKGPRPQAAPHLPGQRPEEAGCRMESQLDHGDSASESRTRKEGPEGGRNVVGLEGWGEQLPRESGQPRAELALGSGSLCGGTSREGPPEERTGLT